MVTSSAFLLESNLRFVYNVIICEVVIQSVVQYRVKYFGDAASSGGTEEAQKACPGRARAQQNTWPDGPDHWPDIYTANLIYLLEILCFRHN